MALKVYVSGMSGNKEVKKRQQRVLMILDSKNIKYEVVDITEPGKEDEKDKMQTKSTSNGATVSDPNPRHPLPPQLFNENEYCGDYDAFDLANEIDTLEEFLKISPSDRTSISSAQIQLKRENGENGESEKIDASQKVVAEDEANKENQTISDDKGDGDVVTVDDVKKDDANNESVQERDVANEVGDVNEGENRVEDKNHTSNNDDAPSMDEEKVKDTLDNDGTAPIATTNPEEINQEDKESNDAVAGEVEQAAEANESSEVKNPEESQENEQPEDSKIDNAVENSSESIEEKDKKEAENTDETTKEESGESDKVEEIKEANDCAGDIEKAVDLEKEVNNKIYDSSKEEGFNQEPGKVETINESKQDELAAPDEPDNASNNVNVEKNDAVEGGEVEK